MAQPDGKKIFFENLSGAGKAIAVLTSGGDAQGKALHRVSKCVVDRIRHLVRILCGGATVPAGGRRLLNEALRSG